MRKWHVVYEGASRDVVVDEGEIRAVRLKHFDEAAATGTLAGRRVAAMWIIDHGTAQADVIRIHGRVPPLIEARHRWRSLHQDSAARGGG
jgi:hypothetical protein